jgi:tRNA nucleotidyltransferase/poly(A) polymerase
MLEINHSTGKFAPDWLYKPALHIIKRLHEAGHEAYIAGGAVRDHLLGRPQNDIDIATSATPSECAALFPRTVPVGASFGVMIVMQRDLAFEVATFRSETGYQDGRHPNKVQFCSAREDVSRRDFTINGLFWDTKENSLLDWVDGRRDIDAKLVRCIGNPKERFTEDHLRMLRAIRFAAQLNFEVEPTTALAIRDLACHICDVSMERVRIEIEKLLQSENRGMGLQLLTETGLGAVVWRRLFTDPPKEWTKKPGPFSTEQDSVPNLMPHFLANLSLQGGVSEFPALAWWIHLLELSVAGGKQREWLDALPHQHSDTKSGTGNLERQRNALSNLLQSDAGGLTACVQQLGRALRFSRDELQLLKRAHGAYRDLAGLENLSLANQLRLARHPGLHLAQKLHAILCPVLATNYSRTLQSLQSKFADRLSQKILLTGRDLLAMGVPPGPRIGEALTLLEDEQLEGRLATVDTAKKWLLQYLATSGS